MKVTPALAIAGLLALCACDQVNNDPDIQEARTAIKGAMKDDGAALKQVYNEARATRDTNEAADDVGP
ncbi:MAG TPA: hypothetical protein VF122_00240 [Caulobacteraceae bacterium]